MKLKERFYQFLKWLGKYTKTDMVYVFEGSFWWVLGRIFGFLFSFLILVSFAKFAQKEVYGAYQYVISTVAILGILSLPGIQTALIRAVAQGKERTFFICEREILKFGFLTFFSIFAISSWYFFHKNFDLGISFLIASIFLPLISVFSLYLSFWQGKKKFDIQNIYFIFSNFLAAVILISFLYFKPKIVWVIFGYYFAFSFSNFLFWVLTRKKINRETEEDKETISFGKHLTLMGLPATISSQIDNVILWQVGGPVALAIYSFALRLVERLQELVPFSAIALPKMAQRNLKEDSTKKAIFDKFLKLFLISVPFTLLYIAICPLFFKIFFPNYKEAVIYSQILSLTLIFSPFSFLSTAFLAEAKKRELYILNFTPQILKILLFFALIPIFKIWGGVFSILISQIFFGGLTLYLFKKL